MHRSRPGAVGFRVSATGSAGLDWPTLDAMWSSASEYAVFDAGWMSDHLSDASQERGGVAFEAFTTLAALAHRVPGRWLGIAVASVTFRHPAVLVKAATVLDNVTGGQIRRALELVGRDPDDFTVAAQLDCGSSSASRKTSLETARRFVAAGANHMILGVPATAGPDGLAAMAREVAEPLVSA